MRNALTVLFLALLLNTPFALADDDSVAPLPKDDKNEAETGGAADGVGCSLGSGVTPLSEGVATSASLTGDTGASCEFSFVPAAGIDTVRFVMPPTTPNDFDLYVRLGSLPGTLSGEYDCRPFSGATSTETCEVSVLSGSTVFVMVRRFSGTGGSFSVTPTSLATCSLGPGPIALASGVPAAGSLTDVSGAACVFSFAGGAGVNFGSFAMTPATGNLNVYVRKEAVPGIASGSFDCSSLLTGTATDTCGIAIDGAATYYMRVLRSTLGGAFSATATGVNTCSVGPGVNPLTSGVSVGATITAEIGGNCVFSFVPGATADLASFVVAPSATNLDLYVRKNAIPGTATGQFDCRPLLAGTATETCTLGVEAGATYYVLVRRPTGSLGAGGFTITATALSTCSLGGGNHALSDGVALLASLTADAGASCFFVFAGDYLAGNVRFTASPAAGDFDLYVKRGAVPTTTTFDCKSALVGTATETCVGEMQGPGDVHYAMVRRFSGSGAFTVTATSFSSCDLGAGIHTLTSAAAQPGTLAADVGGRCYFELVPSSGSDLVRFQLPATSPADFDLYMRAGSLPTVSLYDCRPFSGGSVEETCEALTAPATTYFAMVRRFSGSGPFSVTGTDVVFPLLDSGVPQVGNVSNGGTNYYKVVLPAGGSLLSVALAGLDTGNVCTATMSLVCDPANSTNADLYLRKATSGLPSAALNDCKAASPGSQDTCTENDALFANAGSSPTDAAGPVQIRAYGGDGKHFVAVKGTVGPVDYAVVAVYA